MIAAATDTHAIIWYLYNDVRLSSRARNTFEQAAFNDSEGLFIEIPLHLGIARTLSRVSSAEIPDMPDRIIAATALHLNIPLISRDGQITLSSIETIW